MVEVRLSVSPWSLSKLSKTAQEFQFGERCRLAELLAGKPDKGTVQALPLTMSGPKILYAHRGVASRNRSQKLLSMDT